MVALQSDKRPLLELSEIADLTVKEQLQTISDVSSVSIWGEKRYSMRLWLDPIKMSGYGITPIDVKNAIDKENVELPSGSIEGNTTELTIRTLGLMHTAEEFNNLIIKEEKHSDHKRLSLFLPSLIKKGKTLLMLFLYFFIIFFTFI